ncbi:MAG: heparinase II/III-family protein [Lentisphaeria bacterium]|nr:heparinase II/III-family protein [Lentisphaeria bacterium]NQZ70446.1 heparinase II/III-family protein [Lentisphaeria bacterium]
MTHFNIEEIKETIATCELSFRQGRDLLIDPQGIDSLRARAADSGDMLPDLKQQCQALLEKSPEAVSTFESCGESLEAERMAAAYLFFEDTAYSEWAKKRITALIELDTWLYPVHASHIQHTDHTMTNTGSYIARAHSLLADVYSEDENKTLAEGLRKNLFQPYLESTRERLEWWTKEQHESNWKIMCHGETGLMICEFAEYWSESREALGLAVEGVIEIFDMVPPEGDWPEGVCYWLATVNMGLRLAEALKRLTNGAVDLFEHPALKVTGDFVMMLATSAGRVFNVNDNHDYFMNMHSEGIATLASGMEREDWMYIARLFPTDTYLYLAAVNPEQTDKIPERTTALFPYSGMATMRSGWNKTDTFIGVKCSASDVPHSHLDAGTFCIESGGQWLVRDEGYWPYAHAIGFFDNEDLRWNWDGLISVGHSTLLFDGQGQTWGKDYPGHIESLTSGDGWDMIITEATKTYPGLITKFIRTFLFVHPGTIIIRDVVQCEGERHAEWLLHYAGEIRSEGLVSVIENNGASMTIVPFLPDRENGWRCNDVLSTSTYMEEISQMDKSPTIRYRGFSPFRKADSFEFLFGLQIDGKTDGSEFDFETEGDSWVLKLNDQSVIRPDGDSLKMD